MFVRSLDPFTSTADRSAAVSRHDVLSSDPWGSQFKVSSLFMHVHCPWLHEQVIHSDVHLLGSGADANIFKPGNSNPTEIRVIIKV